MSILDRLRAELPGITGSMADVSLAAEVESVFDDVETSLGGSMSSSATRESQVRRGRRRAP